MALACTSNVALLLPVSSSLLQQRSRAKETAHAARYSVQTLLCRSLVLASVVGIVFVNSLHGSCGFSLCLWPYLGFQGIRSEDRTFAEGFAPIAEIFYAERVKVRSPLAIACSSMNPCLCRSLRHFDKRSVGLAAISKTNNLFQSTR